MSLPPPEAKPPAEVRSIATLRRLVARFRPVRAAAAGVLVLLLLRSALELAPNWIVGLGLNALGEHEGTGGPLPREFVDWMWVLGIVLVLKSLAQYVSSVAASAVGQRMENSLRSDLFRHVTRLRFAYHDENRSGATIARSLRDMQKARHFFREVWFGYAEVGLLLVGVTVVTFAAHWTYGTMVLVIFGGGVASTMWVGRGIARMDRVASDHYDRVTTVLQENIAGARVVRAFGREPDEISKFGGNMDSFSGSWTAVARFWTGIMPIIGHVYRLALPLALLLGVLRHAAGDANLGEVASVMLYVGLVQHRLRPLTRMVIMGQEAVASATRVFEVLDREEIIETPVRPPQLPEKGGELRIEHVHFGHVGGLHVLRGVSLHVPAGGSLGILGPTGSGKSSLVQLLPRFYDPDSGRVLLDGIDVRELDVRELRATVGLVFQEPFLFSGTVAENIAYGRPGIERAEIERCCRLAAAHEFVTALPLGYETIIGERGVSLSGGQRQRLTIARALAMNPRILVFDDATASVDAVTEKELFRGIRSAARGRTTLVISQRVTSVKWCDRVAVLDAGVVTSVGTHEELLAASALYREIHAHQELNAGAPS